MERREGEREEGRNEGRKERRNEGTKEWKNEQRKKRKKEGRKEGNKKKNHVSMESLFAELLRRCWCRFVDGNSGVLTYLLKFRHRPGLILFVYFDFFSILFPPHSPPLHPFRSPPHSLSLSLSLSILIFGKIVIKFDATLPPLLAFLLRLWPVHKTLITDQKYKLMNKRILLCEDSRRPSKDSSAILGAITPPATLCKQESVPNEFNTRRTRTDI